jgi:hypothetical protein
MLHTDTVEVPEAMLDSIAGGIDIIIIDDPIIRDPGIIIIDPGIGIIG